MARMVRKQFYITPEQNRLLKRRAKALGVSEAELVRRGVEGSGQATTSRQFDAKAWEEEMRFIKKRMRMKVPQSGRSWTRDDLYDGKRFERFSP